MKMKWIALLSTILLAVGDRSLAQQAAIRVHADQVLHRLTRHMTGACLEDVNHEVYGGIYSQMVFGESFQEPPPSPADGVSRMWRPVRRGDATGQFVLEANDPFHGRQSQRITFSAGQGQLGIENRGLNHWGMSFTAGKPYEGYLWLRAPKPTEVFVALESGDGQTVYAETLLSIPDGPWQRRDFTLTPNAGDPAGRLAITLRRPGSVVLGHAFLQPGPWGRFHDLPVRKDVAEALVAQGLTVLRYGGSMINKSPGYRWKSMIGPRDRRQPYEGTWYPYSSHGWGILDFLNFCRAAGFLAIPAFNMDETPQDMADFVEYVNGPADSPWGRRRAADGHLEPYALKLLELGNEEAVNESYWARFQEKAQAIWAKDPNLTIVVGDFLYNGRIEDPMRFPGAPQITSLATHQKILQFAKDHGKPVWFDVHVGNHEPRQPDELGGGIIGLRDFAEALGKLCPGASYKVCVFEENAHNHTMRRGLGHAHAINELERLGNFVPIVCAANCLQALKQNDNGWDQGLLFFTPSQVYGQPSYYVTQMISQHYLPKCVPAEVVSPGNALDVTAKTSDDGRLLQLQVVNLDRQAVSSRIALAGFHPTKSTAEVIQLSGQLDDENTPENPRKVLPQTIDWRPEPEHGQIVYRFPPCSFTILRFE